MKRCVAICVSGADAAALSSKAEARKWQHLEDEGRNVTLDFWQKLPFTSYCKSKLQISIYLAEKFSYNKDLRRAYVHVLPGKRPGLFRLGTEYPLHCRIVPSPGSLNQLLVLAHFCSCTCKKKKKTGIYHASTGSS